MTISSEAAADARSADGSWASGLRVIKEYCVILSEATQTSMRSVEVPAFDVIRNPPQAVPLMTKCEGLRSNRKDLKKRFFVTAFLRMTQDITLQ